MAMVLRNKNGMPKAVVSDKVFYNSVVRPCFGSWDVNPQTGEGTAYIIRSTFTLSNDFVGMGIYIHPGDYFKESAC